MLDIYSVQDIISNFPTKDYIRGKDYAWQGRVKQIIFNGADKLTAYVHGSKRTPYKVKVEIIATGNKKKLIGDCTCPIGYKCKHIVAALIKGMEHLENVPTNALDQPKLDHEVMTWLNALDEKQEEVIANSNKILIYTIEPSREGFIVSPETVSVLKNGLLSTSRKVYRIDQIGSYNPGKHVQDNDMIILRLISGVNNRYAIKPVIPPGEEGSLILKLLLNTRRCYLPGESLEKNYLTMGEMRKASLCWRTEADGTQTIHAKVEGIDQAKVLILQELYYICPLTKTVGVIDTGLPQKQAVGLLKAPAIKPEQAAAINEKLAALTVPELLPAVLPVKEQLIQPIPHLRLCESIIQPLAPNSWVRRHFGAAVPIAAAALSFNYEGKYLAYNDPTQEIRRFKDGEVLVTPRNHIAEKEILSGLQKFGFSVKLEAIKNFYEIKKSDYPDFTIGEVKQNFHKDDNVQKRWETFMQERLPRLKEQGWQISMDQDFPYNIVYADDEWYAEVEESGIDWFGVELGVTIDGKRLNLVPILLNLLKKDNDIFEIIKNLPTNKPLLLSMEDGRRIALPSERAKILLTTMQHLFSFHGDMDEEGRLKLQSLDAALIAEMEAAVNSLNMRWFGGEKVRNLGKQLKGFTSVSDIAIPQTFQGRLRNYQQEGLNWLQFLREYNLAGILADDMGLGKTVQLLAHIATEKAAKRLKYPFLVIAPTSLMANWKAEAKRFVPDLKVLILHGSARKGHFKDIKEYDLVLTTYPLLARDKDILFAHEYHTIILDEAQTIKNTKAKVTQIVNQLKASYRLCMTGTPIENHLGELWSLFNFLLPGYLGTYKQFSNLFRTPIEKAGDIKRSEALSKRIKPFVLRRTKQEVVTELPAKTEIVRMIELEGAQRDLYETIRISMHDKVQKEIAARGVEKSHIIVLDALLKLRQACCDPELLKMATSINQSAKRNELMTMLTTMMEEGRKILLFSQFTSMLALIERELNKENIPYVILTGKTKDRETPIRQFQEGEVPLFLISLKAGGMGLNLTAADAVIHYDPWWNPAVENQATDRAYRIGQDKPVFVYKLITLGTVEEKIIEMQAKKRQLMDNLFDPAAKTSTKLTAHDIQSLFEALV